MIFKTFVSTAAAVAALASSAAASIAPSYPSPGTIWTTGKEYTLTWADDNTAPDLATGWTNFKIQFMTGSNTNQTVLSTVASGLDATKISSYAWTAPAVDPNSAIYFFMYTNDAGLAAWTTRFGIIAKDGDALVPETEAIEPDGAAIPWGNGKLAASDAPAPDAATTSASAAASESPVVSSDVAAATTTTASPASASGDDTPAAASSSDEVASKVTAVNEKVTEDSGVDKMLRAPLVQVGFAVAAVVAVALA